MVREVTIFQQNLSKTSSEYGQRLSRFQAELGRQQGEIGKISQEINSMLQQYDRYEKQANTYYTWANQEITKFISNNERTTSRALTQQALNK